MPEKIYIDPNLYKNFAKLQRSGKKAVQAKDKAEQIITRLRSGETMPDQVGTVTKHGELRIKGAMKYDLGSGYRLITYKHGRCFYLLFIGSHDECHRWIENNRELTPGQIEDRCIPLTLRASAIDPSGEMEPVEMEEEEWDPLAAVDEQVLRKVFCGLVGSND